MLRWFAVFMATWALAETSVHLITPRFSVSAATLSIARRVLVQPKERTDFNYLAAQPIWHGEELKTMLEHVELAGYNRELINWLFAMNRRRKTRLQLSRVICANG